MKVAKIISKGVGELISPSSVDVQYVLKNVVKNNKLERTPSADIVKLNNNFIKKQIDKTNCPK